MPAIREIYHSQMVAMQFSRECDGKSMIEYDYVKERAKKDTVPADWDSCDWRFRWVENKQRWRFPKYYNFTCHASCHWRVGPDAIVANLAFPTFDWYIIESDSHSAVVDTTHRYIFDPTYFALGVTPYEAWEQIYEYPESIIKHPPKHIRLYYYDYEDGEYDIWEEVTHINILFAKQNVKDTPQHSPCQPEC